MHEQNTFTLIPERCVTPNGNTPHRPMTSKQVKKAHKEANKGPKLSRMEQRKLELAEQERIRKELEKDRVAARARNARERKKAKEDAKKEEKRRSGRPLVDVRPSQDTIARFVRGNGSGKKRDGSGREIRRMPSVAEEALEETSDSNHQDRTTAPVAAESPAGDPGGDPESELLRQSPVSKDTIASHPVEEQTRADNADQEATIVSAMGSEPRQSSNHQAPEAPIEPESVPYPATQEPAELAGRDQETTALDTTTSNQMPPASFPADSIDDEMLEELDPKPIDLAPPASFSADSVDDAMLEKLDSKPSEPIPPASFSVDAIDEEMLEELDCMTGPLHQGPALAAEANRNEPQDLPVANVEQPEATQEMIFDDFDDDIFNDLRTSFTRQEATQKETERGPQPALDLPRAASQSTNDFADADLEDDVFEALDITAVPVLPRASQDNGDFADAEVGEDAFEALDAMLGLQPPSIYKPRGPSQRTSPFRGKGGPAVRREFSSFTDGDLDEELLQQLEADAESSSAKAVPAKASDQRPPVEELEDKEPEAEHCFPEPPGRNLAPVRNSPAQPQTIPPNTQAALLAFVDDFPTPSQQILDIEMPPPAPQLTPCPPPKRTQGVPSKTPIHPSQPKQKKQFFSPSGDNALLATAIHISKREELQRQQAGAFMAARQQLPPPPRNLPPKPPTNTIPSSNFAAHQQPQAGRTTFKQLSANTNGTRQPPIRGGNHPPSLKQADSAATTEEIRPSKPAVPILPEKENLISSQDLTLMASQETEYDGGWIDEIDDIAHDLLGEKAFAVVR